MGRRVRAGPGRTLGLQRADRNGGRRRGPSALQFGGRAEYPFVEALDLVHQLHDTFGPRKLVWGSDIPNVERFCSYKQSLDYVRRYCEFLTPREKDLILGDTCAAFYGIKQAAVTV